MISDNQRRAVDIFFGLVMLLAGMFAIGFYSGRQSVFHDQQREEDAVWRQHGRLHLYDAQIHNSTAETKMEFQSREFRDHRILGLGMSCDHPEYFCGTKNDLGGCNEYHLNCMYTGEIDPTTKIYGNYIEIPDPPGAIVYNCQSDGTPTPCISDNKTTYKLCIEMGPVGWEPCYLELPDAVRGSAFPEKTGSADNPCKGVKIPCSVMPNGSNYSGLSVSASGKSCYFPPDDAKCAPFSGSTEPCYYPKGKEK